MKQGTFGFGETNGWVAEPPPDLSRVKDVTIDWESTGLRWFDEDEGIGLAVSVPGWRSWYFPIKHKTGNIDPAVLLRFMRHELRGKIIRGFHSKFELHISRKFGVELRDQGNTFVDVGHHAALLDDHRKRFKLQHLAEDEGISGKLDPGDKANLADQDAGSVAPYAMRDCTLVDELLDLYAPRIEAEDLGRVLRLESDIIPATAEFEMNGMPIDVPMLEQWDIESRAILNRLTWDLRRHAGFTVNPDAPTHMKRLFEQCGEPLRFKCRSKRCQHIHAPADICPKCGEESSLSFDALIFRPAAARHEAIQLAWRIAKLNDLRSKFITKYLKEHVNGIIYPSLNQLMTDDGGTISGRYSATLGMHQVMNADKHGKLYAWLAEYGANDFFVKRLFKPAPGKVWASADMRQVEYRFFAHLTQYIGSTRLIKRYEEDPLVSFHKIVGEDVLRIQPLATYTDVKVFNFLSVFGGGVNAASRSLGIPYEDAKVLSDAYHEANPEVRQLLDFAMQTADERGYILSILGRRSRFPGKPGKRSRLHKALNAAIQPSAADANKLAIRDVYAERKRLELTMRMTVHDSLEGDLTNPSKMSEYSEVLNTQRLPLSVPLLWETGCGPSWAEAKA